MIANAMPNANAHPMLNRLPNAASSLFSMNAVVAAMPGNT